MKADEIRRRFVDYYTMQGFHPLPRAPMIHPSIPMSFVMSAGLIQVETSLARAEDRPGDEFVLVQECFRHFDLDRVGSDSLHLSLFEMPGAFVFGPNGKAATVQRMWTLATSILGIDRERIWVSYFGGGEVLGDSLEEDCATQQAWLDVGVPEHHIVSLGPEHNYWVQGGGIDGLETPRKAGPNTELFYERVDRWPCGTNCRPGCRCGRFVEFSNSLFISREQDSEEEGLRPMAEPFSETVIGTERVAMILQGVDSVFRTAVYRPVIETIESFVDEPELPEALVAESERVIGDHLKALYVLVADGAPPPGKNGRERIVKLLIRGVVTRQILLDIRSSEFVPTVMEAIRETVHSSVRGTPEDEGRMMSYFSSESERFRKTIERARRKLERLLEENDGCTLSGSQILFLEKRKGLPHLLTAMMLRDKGLAFAEAAYREALKAWKQKPHN